MARSNYQCALPRSSCAMAFFIAGALWGATAAPVFAAATAGTDMIAGRLVESFTHKTKASKSTVVFENGSRATVDSWNKVIDVLSPSVSIFAYNRPGYGKSQTRDTPRDGITIVEELRQMLKHQGMTPPYILVGHSMGGLYMQLYARRYPDEVSGLVLVDSLYPGVIKKPEDFPLLTRGAKRLFFSATVNREIDAIYATGEQVLSFGPIDEKPIVQLFNQPKGATAIPVDFGVVNQDKQTQALVRGLYPKAKKIILDSDHQMQSQSSTEVAEAIKGIIAAEAAANLK